MSETNEQKYASLSVLQLFLDNLRGVFANASHTHTKAEITDFDIQEIVDTVIEQLPNAEEGNF